MTRVAIFASTLSRANELAEVVEPGSPFRIVDVRALPEEGDLVPSEDVDVIVAEHVNLQAISSNGPPFVVIGGRGGSALLRNRVRAWLPPDVTSAELSAAMVAAALELTVLTETQAQRWLRSPTTPDFDIDQASQKTEALTSREGQVLRMLADGLGNKEIAGVLHISEHTAKFHVAQILAKLGVTSRAAAVTAGIRRGLIPI